MTEKAPNRDELVPLRDFAAAEPGVSFHRLRVAVKNGHLRAWRRNTSLRDGPVLYVQRDEASGVAEQLRNNELGVFDFVEITGS